MRILWLMTLCKHFMSANSPFRCWGAWLGQSATLVVCPARFCSVGEAQSGALSDRFRTRGSASNTNARSCKQTDVAFTVHPHVSVRHNGFPVYDTLQAFK